MWFILKISETSFNKQEALNPQTHTASRSSWSTPTHCKYGCSIWIELIISLHLVAAWAVQLKVVLKPEVPIGMKWQWGQLVGWLALLAGCHRLDQTAGHLRADPEKHRTRTTSHIVHISGVLSFTSSYRYTFDLFPFKATLSFHKITTKTLKCLPFTN